MLQRVAVLTACALALSPAALAAHGKVGTWEATIQSNGMAAMPDMSKLPPSVQAQMKARGVHMNAGGMTTKFCMTAEQVKNDKPELSRHGACETVNLKMTGNTFSADMVCKGETKMRGHVEVTFDSAEHYTGRTTMTMTVEGQTTTRATTMEARWLSPTCTVKSP
ncbi:MAG: DUF3617 domain-containing protein [Rhizomicrobium sp.]|nr:DUF3617 domain-containing protein [Rhizomicrobium sp.]